MSSYLNIYLKDIDKETYVILHSSCGYFRDVFRTELGYNVKYDENNNPLASLVSKDNIKDIIQEIEREIQRSMSYTNNAEKHIQLIAQMEKTSISDRLEAIAQEEEAIKEYQEEIKVYQRVKNFYTVLLDLSDGDRIYAGIDCFAPDGSDIEE